MDKLTSTFSLESLENRQLLDAHLSGETVFLIHMVAISATAAGAAGLSVGLSPMWGFDSIEVASFAAFISGGIISVQFACTQEKGQISFVAMNIMLSTATAVIGVATGTAVSAANWAYSSIT